MTPEQIRLQLNDTATCPNSGPAAASRCQYMVGQATINAAEQLIAAMRKPDGSFRNYREMVDEGLIAMSAVEVIRYVDQEGVRLQR